MRTSLLTYAFTVLFAATIGAASATAEQAGGANPPEQTTYQTKGIAFDTRLMAQSADASYWEQRVARTYRVTADPRMLDNEEERDAVLAAVWQVKPDTISTETRMVTIIKRPSKPQSKELAYQITFLPRTSEREKDRIEARFISEGTAARVTAAPLPPAGTAVPRLPPAYTYAGFPNNNLVRYLAEHPDEIKSILAWIAASAGQAFDAVLTTNVVEGGTARSACFRVSGAKAASGTISRLSILFLGTTVPVFAELPARYDAKDFTDLEIEKLQAEAREPEKLGAITGLAELPAGERFLAKYAILQYFRSSTRDAEVDAIVPVPRTEKRILLTLRFGAGNNVSVQRIGESVKGSTFGYLGDVRRANGFGANSTDIPTLTAWLKKRYPAVTPKGADLTELTESVTAEIRAKSGTPAWFKENYGIDILAASDAGSRLTRSFQLQPQQLVDLKDFTPSELQLLEATLENISDHLVSSFKGLQMARQKVAVELVGVTATKLGVNNPFEAGVAIRRDHDRLIVIFDSSSMNSGALFVGGVTSAGGKPEFTDETLLAFAHELGHVLAAMPGVNEAFEGVVAAKKIKPVTWYAASNPKSELFPEAFALYVGDPEWLRGNRPDLFRWFEMFSKGQAKETKTVRSRP